MTLKYNYRGEEKTCEVKNRVDYVTVERIISAIVDNVFDADGNYTPWKRYFLTWGTIVGVYTDVDLDQMEADDIHELIENDDFIAGLSAIISRVQLLRISDCANKMIEARLNEHPLKPLCKKIEKLVDDAQRVLDELQSDNTGDMENKLNNLLKNPNVQKLLSEIIPE